MEVKTYRAPSLEEALARVRDDFGPGAAVLQTRAVPRRGFWAWRRGGYVEVTAADGLDVSAGPVRQPDSVPREVPSSLEESSFDSREGGTSANHSAASSPLELDAWNEDYRAKFRASLKSHAEQVESLVEKLSRREARSLPTDLPRSLFRVFADLIEADIPEETVRELIEQVSRGRCWNDDTEPDTIMEIVTRTLQERILAGGPIRVVVGRRKLVALVGPTGVGKTTTIAKLAANFRLRDKLRVGLITVDTYRIAAVEQLRTYANIIDLPMEVVTTPREMRGAVSRMSDLDLVLLDTAGRSGRDELQIQQLRSMLQEASPDEIHLVLSSVASSSHLLRTAEKFASVGTTALVLTKLDEATGLGNVLPLLLQEALPLSYLTHGQNVPDDIVVADGRRLVSRILRREE